MTVPLTVNGSIFNYPQDFDSNDWGVDATGWAQAVTSGMLQKAGGSFPLTAAVDFGSSFGVKVLNLTSETVNTASAGYLRLAKTDTIDWRNNANSSNLPLAINGSDQLTFNGVILATNGGGTVNNGTGSHLAWYPSTGTTVGDAAGNTIGGDYTLGGIINVNGSPLTIGNTTNQLILGNTNTTTITSPAPVSSRTYTILDAGGAANFVMSEGAATINGAKTFTSSPVVPSATTSTQAMAFGQNHVFQIVPFSALVETSTTSSTYTSTGLSATIAPSSAAHKILIQVSGVIQFNSASTSNGAIATIFRNSTTDIALSTQGFIFLFPNNAGVCVFGASFIATDSPATTSATTYTVYIKNQDNTSAVIWGVGGNLVTSSIILTEIL